MKSMRKTFVSSVCAGLLLLGPVGVVIAGLGIPGVIYMKSGPRVEPVWVSAEDATVSEKGGMRWQLFSKSDQDWLRRFAVENKRLQEEKKSHGDREPGSDCPSFLYASDEERIDPKPNGSFSDLVEQSLAIYSGRIESISKGFFSGSPSSLLRVKVVDAFRSSSLVAKKEILIPHSFAQFKIGESTFCGGSPDGYQPALGDQVLVFIYDAPLNADRTLVYPRSPEVFFQTGAGRLIVPGPLKTDKAIAIAGNLERLEKLLRQDL